MGFLFCLNKEHTIPKKTSRLWAALAGASTSLLLVCFWGFIAALFLEPNTIGYYVSLLIAGFCIYQLGRLVFYRVRFAQFEYHYQLLNKEQAMADDTREEKLLKDIFTDPETRATQEAEEKDLDKFLKAAKAATVETIEKHELGRGITVDDIYIVWFVKVLQNWKALVSTTDNDGMYYEVTYNGDRCEAYVDAYSKYANNVVTFY